MGWCWTPLPPTPCVGYILPNDHLNTANSFPFYLALCSLHDCLQMLCLLQTQTNPTVKRMCWHQWWLLNWIKSSPVQCTYTKIASLTRCYITTLYYYGVWDGMQYSMQKGRYKKTHQSWSAVKKINQHAGFTHISHKISHDLSMTSKDHFPWPHDVMQQCTIFYFNVIKPSNTSNLLITLTKMYVNWKAKIQTLVLDTVILYYFYLID